MLVEFKENIHQIMLYLLITNRVIRENKKARYLCLLDICRFQPPINKTLSSHMEYTESLPAPSGTHEASRLSQNLTYKTQVGLTLALPDYKLASYLQADPTACQR